MLANLDVRVLPRERLDWLRDFVSVRGGGLLMLGARSFDAQALAGTPIEELLPLRPAESNGIMPVVATSGAQAGRVRVTLDGLRHPMMRIAATDEEASRRWAQLPALAGHVRLGAPRPGASVLAVADGAGGALEPVVASQRFGAGRTLVFTGEASWRWKMMLPASDGTYDRFWRQAARWLTTEAADPVSLEQVTPAATGGDVVIAATVRDAEFRPAPTATVSVKVERANGAVEELTPTLVDGARARFTARVAAGDAGVNRVHVEAQQGADAARRSAMRRGSWAASRPSWPIRAWTNGHCGAWLTPQAAPTSTSITRWTRDASCRPPRRAARRRSGATGGRPAGCSR